MSEVAISGIEVGEVVDNNGLAYNARLVWEADQPAIRFYGDGAPRYSYTVATLLKVDEQPEFLHFDMGQGVCVAWPQVHAVVMTALKCIPGSVGCFEVKWVEADSRVPF